jgi:hypothetical protein
VSCEIDLWVVGQIPDIAVVDGPGKQFQGRRFDLKCLEIKSVSESVHKDPMSRLRTPGAILSITAGGQAFRQSSEPGSRLHPAILPQINSSSSRFSLNPIGDRTGKQRPPEPAYIEW